MTDYNAKHKQIEDIIDARKETGQYDVLINSLKSQSQNIRYAYTAPMPTLDEIRDEFAVLNVEGDNNNEFRAPDFNRIGQTDSEITLIRVKRENSHCRTSTSNGNAQDEIIPGDGAHLGESPSLVNLATLIIPASKCKINEEYLVPLSSWEPVEQVSGENVERKKSAASFKDVFKCFMFWKKSKK